MANSTKRLSINRIASKYQEAKKYIQSTKNYDIDKNLINNGLSSDILELALINMGVFFFLNPLATILSIPASVVFMVYQARVKKKYQIIEKSPEILI